MLGWLGEGDRWWGWAEEVGKERESSRAAVIFPGVGEGWIVCSERRLSESGEEERGGKAQST